MNGKFYLICFIPLSLGANTSMNFSTSKLVLENSKLCSVRYCGCLSVMKFEK